ncbi:MAG: hypothetical protein ACPLPS_10005 [bacterium]
MKERVLLLVWGKNRFNISRYFLTGMNAQHSSRELLSIPDIPLLG